MPPFYSMNWEETQYFILLATVLNNAYDRAHTIDAFRHPIPRFWSHYVYISWMEVLSEHLVLLANTVGTVVILQQGRCVLSTCERG